MLELRIKRLNQMLGDAFGLTIWGEPRFKWAHTRDLLHPVIQPHGAFSWQRQVEEDRWVVAAWMPPPTPEEWRTFSGGDLKWPERGLYYASNWQLRNGAEPDERATHGCIDALRHKAEIEGGGIGQRGVYEYLTNRAGEIDKAAKQRVSDYVDDAATAFGNVPGSRGFNVSMPSIQPREIPA